MSTKTDLTLLDPDFSRGTSTFEFENGDQYEGEYCAHRTGIVWREGTGTYTTKDGQTYTGLWKDDKLVEASQTEVHYPSGVQYYGNIIKNKYGGSGMYVFESKMSLICQFNQNKPIGELSLIDVNGREWHGTATADEALLLPEHIYYNNISYECGKGRLRHEPTRVLEEEAKLSLGPKFDPLNREIELKIFAKTRKTISDLQFQESDWYKNYMNFKSTYTLIKDKIKDNNECVLEPEEREWYKKFKEFKKRYLGIMDARKQNKRKLSEYILFQLYNSKEFKNKCPPVRMMYPRGPCGDVCTCPEAEDTDS